MGYICKGKFSVNYVMGINGTTLLVISLNSYVLDNFPRFVPLSA